MPLFRYFNHPGLLAKAGLKREVKKEKTEDVKPSKEPSKEDEIKPKTCHSWKSDLFSDIPDTDEMVDIDKITQLTPISFKVEGTGEELNSIIQSKDIAGIQKQKFMERVVAEMVSYAYDQDDIFSTYQPSDIKHYNATPLEISNTGTNNNNHFVETKNPQKNDFTDMILQWSAKNNNN